MSAILLPARREFASRDDFAAAAANVLAELQDAYDALPVLMDPPEWARSGHGRTIFNVSLPLSFTRHPEMVYYALNSLMNGMFERGLAIKKLARVENGGKWFLWAEAE